MSERRGVTFERLYRMEKEYAEDDDVLDVIAAVRHLSMVNDALRQEVRDLKEAGRVDD